MRVYLSWDLVRKAIVVGRLVVLERVHRAMGFFIVGGNGTCSGGLACTLGGSLCVGSFGSTLGAGWGDSGGVGVCVSTLGDQRTGIGVGLCGVGRVVG